MIQPQNSGDGWTTGIEIESRLSLGLLGMESLAGIELWGNATFLDSKVKNPGTGRKNSFDDQPETLFNLGMDLAYPQWGTTFSLSWNYTGKAKKFEMDGTQKGKAALSTVDLSIHKHIYKNLFLVFEAENLFDKKKGENERLLNGVTTSSNNNFGRTFFLGTEIRF